MVIIMLKKKKEKRKWKKYERQAKRGKRRDRSRRKSKKSKKNKSLQPLPLRFSIIHYRTFPELLFYLRVCASSIARFFFSSEHYFLHRVAVYSPVYFLLPLARLFLKSLFTKAILRLCIMFSPSKSFLTKRSGPFPRHVLFPPHVVLQFIIISNF